MPVKMKQQQDIALRSIQNQRNKANKVNTDNQNKIQSPDTTNLSWSDEPWQAQKAAATEGGGACDIMSALGGQNMEPYVYVRLLNNDRSKTGLADKTQSVSVVGEQAIFRSSDANELLEDCNITSKQYPDPGSLLVYLRVYDDDVGDDDCIGQAILDVRDVIEKRSGKESFTSMPIYDEEHGEMMCHCEMSALWTKNDEGGTLTIKIFRLYDFREDIDAGEGTQACIYLLYFLVYLLIGAGLFKAFEDKGWGCNNYFDAVWFMVITITSVGYGDCFPETSGTKVLNFFMIITNILCIGWMFSIAVQQMIVMQERLQRKLKGSIQNTMWKKGDGDEEGEAEEEAPMTKDDDFRTTTIMCATLIVLTCLIYGLNGDEMCMVYTIGDDGTKAQGGCGTDPETCPGWTESTGGTINTLPGGTCPASGDCCMGRTNDAGFMNFWDVLQFTVVTMATVGYGDVSPKTAWGKVYGMFFAMIGVAALARLGALVVDNVMEKAHREKMEKILGQTLTSLDELTVFDADNDGRIDRYEFLMKMLVMTHECSQDTIDRIMGRFNQIDKDGDGDIDADDFLAMMKKKVDVLSPRGKDNDVEIDVNAKASPASPRGFQHATSRRAVGSV